MPPAPMAAPSRPVDLEGALPLLGAEGEVVARVGARIARVVLLVLSDLAAVSAAASGAYLVWARSVLGQPVALYLELLPLVALLPAGYMIAGLYPGFGLGPLEIIRRQTRMTSLVLLTTAALVFILKVPDLYSRATFFLFGLGVVVLVPLLRSAVVSRAHRLPWWPEPCLVVATADRLPSALEALQRARRLGYRPAVARIHPGPGADGAAQGDDLVTIARRGVRVAIVDAALERSLRRELQACFRRVILLREYADAEMAEPRDLGGVVGFEFRNELLHRRNRLAKRGLDLGLAGVALLLALPVMAVAIALVKLVSSGPGLFRQERLGRDGRSFHLWKIRTMVQDADVRLAEVLAADPLRRREWEDGFKMADDPRVLPWVGRFLRRSCIDELPQLWNVLRGEMSLVGPRPLPAYHLRELDAGHRELRQRVLPGMTGLWQVRDRGSGNAETQRTYDEYYVRTWSVWLDAYILARTVAIVLRGRPDVPELEGHSEVREFWV